MWYFARKHVNKNETKFRLLILVSSVSCFESRVDTDGTPTPLLTLRASLDSSSWCVDRVFVQEFRLARKEPQHKESQKVVKRFLEVYMGRNISTPDALSHPRFQYASVLGDAVVDDHLEGVKGRRSELPCRTAPARSLQSLPCRSRILEHMR